MEDTMRAMLLSECAPIESKPLRLTRIKRHSIRRPDEILLKIEACGVCHSALPLSALADSTGTSASAATPSSTASLRWIVFIIVFISVFYHCGSAYLCYMIFNPNRSIFSIFLTNSLY